MARQSVRPIRIEGEIAYVPLTQGKTAIVDAADAVLVEGSNWCAVKDHNVFYAVTSWPNRNGIWRHIRLHRLILGVEIGVLVDHEDRDGLNCRRSNLRIATKRQNMWNRVKATNNTSGFKGVCWNKRCCKWQAAIRIQGRITHLGMFNSAESAHAAYCAASAEYHGEFGRTK